MTRRLAYQAPIDGSDSLQEAEEELKPSKSLALKSSEEHMHGEPSL